MTAHEIFVSLFWLVVIAYAAYLARFATMSVRSARRSHRRIDEDV